MKRRIHQNIYGNWKGYLGRRQVEEFGHDEVAAHAWLATGLTGQSEEAAQAWLDAHDRLHAKDHKENPMKHFREPFHVDFHSERGEVSIYVTDADDNEVWYGNDETVRELIEDGFIDTKGFIMGRNARPEVLERSVISYLRSVGVIPTDEARGRNDISVYEDNADLYDENPRRKNPYNEDLDLARDEVTDVRDMPLSWKDTRRGRASLMSMTRHFVSEQNKRGEDFMFEQSPDAVRMIGFRRRNPGDVHIDIHSHNTRGGGSVRARNPLIRTVADFDKALADGPYAWPGGYPMFFSTADGAALSFKTAKENRNVIASAIMDNDRRSGWCVTGVDVNWEDNDLYDDHSGEKIESAYGENPRARRTKNPTTEDVAGWVDHYREKMMTRVDGVPEKAHYVVKITTKDGEEAWLRVGKGTKFDTDPSKARVYRNGDKANEAATKVLNYLKKKQPAKAKKIQSISAEPKK